MRSTQLFMLAFIFLFINVNFIALDLNNGFMYIGGIGNPCDYLERYYLEQYEKGDISEDEAIERMNSLMFDQLNENDLVCAIGGEIYEPFIYLTLYLWIGFMVIGFIELRYERKHMPKNKKGEK